MQIHEVSLPKKKLITEDRTYLLWESVGRCIVEAQLTPVQIQQVFAQAESGATAAGGNRTAVGQVKDAGSAVATAWNDLKLKVQNSGPIKNVDAAYDQAAEKLKQATGGDAGVMRYVEKYRKFAKEHPVAQSFIYAALIAAAGISGAGVGGAAALGLLKMTDKLLQGEKFSSAAWSGAKTGAVAYGASLLNDLLAGRAGVTTSVDDPEWDRLKFQGDMMSSKEILTTTNGVNTLNNTIQSIVGPNSKGEYLVTIVHNYDLQQFVTKTPPPSVANESLRESQIRKAFYVACGLQTQLNEGVWDSIKGAAGKAAGAVGKYAQTKGHNLTTRVTADKLMSAWKSAGSPTDSEAVADVMRNAGVDEQIVTSVLAAVSKTHTGGRVAGQLSQTPNAVRQRQARAAKKNAPTTTAPAKTTTPPATGGAGSFGQMAQQVTAPTTPATQTSSTGGTIQKTATGLIHKANPNNPNLKVKESDKYVKYVSESWNEYKVDEGFNDFVKGVGQKVGQGVGAVKKLGTAVASPFRDVAAGYRGGKVDAQTNAIADKAYRSWSAYRQQLDKNAPGGKADPATLEKQLMAFVSKNLLGGQYLPNLINKDQIIKLVKQIAGNDAAPPPPADTNNAPATANANAPQDAAATTPAKIETGKEVALGNLHYRWLGAQWAEVNPKTGKTGKTAEKGIAPELTKMAQAGKFAQPFTSPDAGALGADQMAANAAAGKKAAPNGFDTATGKPLPAPATTGKGVRVGTAPSTPGGATTTAPATPADEPIIIGGKKLDPKFPGDAKTLANLKASGQLNEYADLYKKLHEAVYKAKANNPNAADQTPYVQGRAGAGDNPGQFAKFDPATSTAANAGAGIGAMAAGGQAARTAEKPAPANPANELELFKKLVATAAQAQTEISTGAGAGAGGGGGGGAGAGAGSGGKKVQDPKQLVGAVTQAIGSTVDPGKLKAAGDAIRKNFQIDASIGSTTDDAVDALLMAMGFQPA